MRNDSRHNDSLEARLRARRPEYEAPAGFTDRVLAQLPSGKPRTEPEKRFSFFPSIALGMAALAFAAILAAQFLRKDSEPEQAASNPPPAVAIAHSSELNLALPRITSEQVETLTLQLNQPLEKELEYVISDTRQAIQFVASNFLPEK